MNSLPEPVEIHSNDIPEVEENHELRIETSNMQSETVDSNDTTFTTNLDNVEHARDEVMNEKANEENHKQVTEDDGGKLGINNGDHFGLWWDSFRFCLHVLYCKSLLLNEMSFILSNFHH